MDNNKNKNNRINNKNKKKNKQQGKSGRNKIGKRVVKAINKEIKQAFEGVGKVTTSSAKQNGNYMDCLMDPLNCIARVPQSSSKTIIAKIVRQITVNANSSGNLAFLYFPQNIATSTSHIYPFWVQNIATYTDINVAETTVGFTSRAIGFTAPLNFFSGGRILSSYIKATPNVSLTTASGRGAICMTRVQAPAASTGSISGAGAAMTNLYSGLQQATNIHDGQYVAVAEIAKLESLVGHWVPHEATDLLEFPKVGFITAAEWLENHPNENVIAGYFTGLPANCSISFQFVINQELIPDNNSATTGHLYSVLGEYSNDRSSPMLALRDCYVKTKNFCKIEALR